MSKISVVINTFNEEENIERALKSVVWADEVIVCDMYSDDKTVELAKKLGAKIARHKRTNYVEPARNYAISKASNDWIFILDADEEVPETLKMRLIQISSQMDQIDYVRLPRKNIIFSKWIKSAAWWPDYNIRFFKKGKVHWENEIHRSPKTLGIGLDLDAQEQFAIIHYHYSSISQFLERMDRYTTVQAKELVSKGYKFSWSDLITKPLDEFFQRFFANRGFEDGIHGFALSLLQAFSFLIVYLKVWEQSKFEEQPIDLDQLSELSKESSKDIDYWFFHIQPHKNPIKRLLRKLQK